MSDVLLLLRIEHRHADELLSLLERELALAEQCDLQVLSDIAAYFLDYPDQCHHPVEDSVYRHLQARDPDSAAGVSQLLEEHRYIADMTRAFAKVIAETIDQPATGGERLATEGAHFVRRYRNHMHEEEREFFALAERSLTGDDWASIEFDLFDRPDPLYDLASEDRFRALRERIESRAGQSFVRAAGVRRSRELRSLVDVSSFNRLMAQSQRNFALEARDGRGYVLRHDHEIVLDLPPCSEGRAAWCAWFFLQRPGAPT